jgi:2-polyprenyl-6-methoxyphenol hydroxylase-like FAD-dependent oxidoreductase
MAEVKRALIVGAGIGGLGAGAALAQRGIETDLVELRPHAGVYGVGINQPANSLRALRELGVLDEICAAGFQFDRTGFRDFRNNPIVEVQSKLGGDVPANTALSRRDLHRILIGAVERAGATTHYGTTVEDLADDGDRVHVRLSDGREEDYDVLVAFDGINSGLRKRLFGAEYDPVYTGYVVWRVTVPRPEEVTYPILYQSYGRKAGYIPLSEETMYLLHVTPEPADVRYEKADFADLLRERLEEFEGIVGDIRDNLKDDDEIVYSRLSEVMLPAPWHRGRVLVCGDAAHACAPHITQGAAMALEDAVVLAEELTRDGRPLEAALGAFMERRYPRAKFVQDVSRQILQGEMRVTPETLPGIIEHMRANAPAQSAAVDEFLNQPA